MDTEPKDIINALDNALIKDYHGRQIVTEQTSSNPI